ncbi:MAG: ATP phosphoribosyltransferase regulatory subunit, partial [Patescibacteria group bacterium]
MIEPKVLKGFRDFLPEEALKRQYVIGIVRSTFESFGFEPLETPALEYLETFSGNIGEDENLFFKFKDQGDRWVALRYDQTVPTCRVIAQYPDKISLPFKRYQIQTVWRAEKPQRGRFR